jgi:hypothetical protein
MGYDACPGLLAMYLCFLQTVTSVSTKTLEGLDKMRQHCRAHEAANSLAIGSLEPLLVFGWALQESERKCVDEWLAKAVAKESSSGKPVAATSASSKRSGPSSSADCAKRLKKEASLVEDVDGLFD